MNTMLTVLNLYTVDKIFTEEVEKKLSAMAQMVYINCLLHHFRAKPATVSGAVAFEIFKNDFKQYEKFKVYFQELHKAGLVIISDERISFSNAWGKHIDRSQLEKVSPEEYVAGFQFSPVTKFKDEMIASQNLIELSGMKYKLAKNQVSKMIELFVKEQETFETKYSSYGECVKHFTYWLQGNIDKIPKDSVKSTGKILGE